MLRVEGLTAGYSEAFVLRNMSFALPGPGVHIVSGPNGAGKTTLVHTLAGLLRPRAGTIHHAGVALHRLPAHRVARAGVALVPQGRRVFGSLTVAEHLALAAGAPGRRARLWSVAEILQALPGLRRLLNTPGRYLSGGEQQLLALARALATNPTLLLLDEPTEGLAPALVPTVTSLLDVVADRGATVLVTASGTDPTGASLPFKNNAATAALSISE